MCPSIGLAWRRQCPTPALQRAFLRPHLATANNRRCGHRCVIGEADERVFNLHRELNESAQNPRAYTALAPHRRSRGNSVSNAPESAPGTRASYPCRFGAGDPRLSVERQWNDATLYRAGAGEPERSKPLSQTLVEPHRVERDGNASASMFSHANREAASTAAPEVLAGPFGPGVWSGRGPRDRPAEAELKLNCVEAFSVRGRWMPRCGSYGEIPTVTRSPGTTLNAKPPHPPLSCARYFMSA